MIPPASSAQHLRDGMQKLPQEIYDQIFGLVFHYEAKETVEITLKYKPPFQLQLCRQFREDFIEAYYGKTVWLFRGRDAHIVPKLWIRSLPDDAISILSRSKSSGFDWAFTVTVSTKDYWAYFKRVLNPEIARECQDVSGFAQLCQISVMKR